MSVFIWSWWNWKIIRWILHWRLFEIVAFSRKLHSMESAILLFEIYILICETVQNSDACSSLYHNGAFSFMRIGLLTSKFMYQFSVLIQYFIVFFSIFAIFCAIIEISKFEIELFCHDMGFNGYYHIFKNDLLSDYSVLTNMKFVKKMFIFKNSLCFACRVCPMGVKTVWKPKSEIRTAG